MSAPRCPHVLVQSCFSSLPLAKTVKKSPVTQSTGLGRTYPGSCASSDLTDLVSSSSSLKGDRESTALGTESITAFTLMVIIWEDKVSGRVEGMKRE